jgi:hypothetical protein
VSQKPSTLKEYFDENTSIDGLVYLMLAIDLVKQVNEAVVMIADDRSGYVK